MANVSFIVLSHKISPSPFSSAAMFLTAPWPLCLALVCGIWPGICKRRSWIRSSSTWWQASFWAFLPFCWCETASAQTWIRSSSATSCCWSPVLPWPTPFGIWSAVTSCRACCGFLMPFWWLRPLPQAIPLALGAWHERKTRFRHPRPCGCRKNHP